MKSKPTSMGIVVGLYQDIYPKGLQGEDIFDMATVLWDGKYEVSFEVDRLEVIG
jgi:streptomycin 6-kinase